MRRPLMITSSTLLSVAPIFLLVPSPTDCCGAYVCVDSTCQIDIAGLSCTTPGFFGGCPPGSIDNGFGLCCFNNLNPCDVSPFSIGCWSQMCDICMANGGAVCWQGL